MSNGADGQVVARFHMIKLEQLSRGADDMISHWTSLSNDAPSLYKLCKTNSQGFLSTVKYGEQMDVNLQQKFCWIRYLKQ